MGERANRAVESFSANGGTLYCSQAVLSAFCEKYGLDESLAAKLSCGLNSGFRRADICGAVAGAVLVVGLKHGDSKDICNQKTEEFIKMFKAHNGDITCRDILGCDISTPDGRQNAIDKNLFKAVCVDIVRSAAEILEDLEY